MSGKNNADMLTAAMTAAFVLLPILYYQLAPKRSTRASLTDTRGSISNSSTIDTTIKPPFPQTIRDMLSKCRLAYLSTVDVDASSSHLSLMRFTYLQHPTDGEIVIMSTSKNTKKFAMLQKQEGVALLIHDFEPNSNTSGLYSITLNGKCRIVTDPVKSEEYRQAHLQHNPDYPQFICGEHISILCVDVASARICNINDQVLHWDAASAAKENEAEEAKPQAVIARV